MEEHINPLAITHLLQYTLRSLCCQDDSQWVYAVFWRILPRNYPPPKWDTHGGVYDRSRGNRRNWILVWEDGFCNFAASSTAEMNSGGGGEYPTSSATSSANYGDNQFQHFQAGLQPELFFKMSHEIYNYGEGLIGKVAADHSHKWIYNEPNENQEINFLSAWHNSADAQPRTWEAQFQSGIKTIALIAVREGVVQLGAMNKVVEDLSYVVLLRKKFAYIESIPGVLLPHPSSAAFPPSMRPMDGYGVPPEMWGYQAGGGPMGMGPTSQLMDQYEYYNQAQQQQQQSPMVRMITPSMSSLEALLSKLPSVGPGPTQQGPVGHCGPEAHQFMGSSSAQKIAKEELDEVQYEGVAAIFKIGNSKDIPEIPDFLSNDAKHFLHLCLQRDPSDRPLASQLLDHPFVRDQSVGRGLNISSPSEGASFSFDGRRKPKPLEIHPRRKSISTYDVDNMRKPGLAIWEARDNPKSITSLPVSPSSSPLHRLAPTSKSCFLSPPHPSYAWPGQSSHNLNDHSVSPTRRRAGFTLDPWIESTLFKQTPGGSPNMRLL